MNGDSQGSAAESNVAAVIAGVLLLPAIYVAFWVLDWNLIAKVGFVIVAPSVIGATIAAVVNAARD